MENKQTDNTNFVGFVHAQLCFLFIKPNLAKMPRASSTRGVEHNAQFGLMKYATGSEWRRLIGTDMVKPTCAQLRTKQQN